MATTNIQELLTQGLFTQPKEQPAVNRGRPLVGLELLASEGMRASEGAASIFTDVGTDLRRRLSDTLQERGYDINLLTQEEKLGRELQQLNLETPRSEEHTSELQSRLHLVCSLLLEKKKQCNTQGAEGLWEQSSKKLVEEAEGVNCVHADDVVPVFNKQMGSSAQKE